MKEANINKVIRGMYEKKGEKSEILSAIRQRAYELYSHGKSEADVIAGAFAFGKTALENGKVTKAEIEKEIAKILAIKLDNNKTR